MIRPPLCSRLRRNPFAGHAPVRLVIVLIRVEIFLRLGLEHLPCFQLRRLLRGRIGFDNVYAKAAQNSLALRAGVFGRQRVNEPRAAATIA